MTRPQPAHVQLWQAVRNAQPIPPAWHTDDGIAVRARIEWDRDGQEWVDGLVIRWTRSVVYVQWDDPAGRLPTTGIWLCAGDVRWAVSPPW